MDVDEFLEHHGIKGMRWGVRRKNPSGGKSSGSGPPKSQDAAKASKLHARVKTAGGTHTLSNQELKHLVDRMNLEQQFDKLANPQKTKSGNFATNLLKQVGRQQVGNLANDVAAMAIGAALAKKGIDLKNKKK